MNLVLNYNDIIITYYNNTSKQKKYYLYDGFLYLLTNSDYEILINYIKSYSIEDINNIKLTDIYVEKQINIRNIENPLYINYIITNDKMIPTFINYHIISFDNLFYILINNYLIQINKSDYFFLSNFFLIFILDHTQFSKYNNYIKINLTTDLNTPFLLNNIFNAFGHNINIQKYKEFFNYLNTKTIYLHHINEDIIKTSYSEYPIFILDNYKFSFFYSDDDIILIPPNILMSFYRKYNYSSYELLIFYLIRTNINNLVINYNLDTYNKINLFSLFYADDQKLLKTKISNYNTINYIDYNLNLNKSVYFKNLVNIMINKSSYFSKRYIFDKYIKYGENLYINSSIDIYRIEGIFNSINNQKINFLDIIYNPDNKILSINDLNIYNFTNNDFFHLISHNSDIKSLKLIKDIDLTISTNDSKSIYCICIHIGNIYLFDEIIVYLSKISYKYDLYITIDKIYNNSETLYNELIKEKINTIQLLNSNTTILYIDNIGADIYPFLYTYKYIVDNNIDYKYILKVHTKSDTKWRKKMYDVVFNNNIESIVKHLDNNGIYGHTYINYDYLNHYYLVQILNMISCYFFKNQQMELFNSSFNSNIDIYQKPKSKIISNKFKFVPGTVFWIKSEILNKYPKFINLIDITKIDFNKDFIFQQKLHAIERLFGVLVYMSGYVV